MATVLEAPRVMRTQDNFIRTYSGRKFWPLNPVAKDINIQDIAHSLSLVCRWTGHTYCMYSVAEHSLRVSRLAQQLILRRVRSRDAVVINTAREVALWGLLHDASEAYLCDMPSPLKYAPGMGQLYRSFEERLMWAVAVRFDLSPHMPSVVKNADRILLQTEGRDLMNSFDPIPGVEPLQETIYPMEYQHAEAEFMRRFTALTMARTAERTANEE